MFATNMRILVVDDFATMRRIIKKGLNELGYSAVDEADDGAVAWPMIQKAAEEGNPYQFIISDWNMPKMLGIDLLKNCRQDKRFEKLPFMLVTAESEQKQILEAVKAGVSDYVVKPFSAETLKNKLETVYKKTNPAKAVA